MVCAIHAVSLFASEKTPTAEEMQACASARIMDDRVIDNYWKSETFGKDILSDDFLQQWFSTQLCAMGESPISFSERDGVRIRFLWLRSFHPGISIRVEHNTLETQIISTELAGAGGYSPGAVARQINRTLSPKEWNKIEELISLIDFLETTDK